MTELLDFETLIEIYPDQAGRSQFLHRAKMLLEIDRLALQDALAQHAHEQAQQLLHRLQGTASFLTGSAEDPASIFCPLSEALQKTHAIMDAADLSVKQTQVLHYLHQLEAAVSNAIHPDPAAAVSNAIHPDPA